LPSWDPRSRRTSRRRSRPPSTSWSTAPQPRRAVIESATADGYEPSPPGRRTRDGGQGTHDEDWWPRLEDGAVHPCQGDLQAARHHRAPEDSAPRAWEYRARRQEQVDLPAGWT